MTSISVDIRIYYIAINIKWLKMGDKSRVTSADITRYWHTYLITARLLGCLRMLPFYDVALDMPSHVAVLWLCFRWRQTSMTSCEKLSSNCAESDSNFIKYVFKGYKLSEKALNIYSYIKGLSHCNWWILPLVGISTDTRKLASFDISTRDNKCNNPILTTLKSDIHQGRTLFRVDKSLRQPLWSQ